MILSENVVTASILDASMFRMLSTASAPTFTETDSGIIDLKRIDKRAVIIATMANNVALNHSFLTVCFRIHFQREIILHSSYCGRDNNCRPQDGMLLLTNQVQEVQVFFVLVQYVINQLFLVPAHHIIILTAFFEINLSAIISMLFSLLLIIIHCGEREGR